MAENETQYRLWWRRVANPADHLVLMPVSEQALVRHLADATAAGNPVIIDRIERLRDR